MQQNILYLDYIEQKGHVNFHKIHIDALKEKGYNVKLILHKSIANQLPYSREDYALLLPMIFKQYPKSPLLNRIIFFLCLVYIKLVINIKKYEKVIVASMEEITLGFLPICHNMVIICHGNAKSFKNPIKSFFLNRLSKNNKFVVFNERMAQPFKEHGMNNVFIINHGCTVPFNLREKVYVPLETRGYKHIIFHPSAKVDSTFLNSLKNNKYLENTLNTHNSFLLFRNKPLGFEETRHIRFINGELSHNLYQYLFLKADIILLAYPKTFDFQVSGVSFECIANKKKILIAEHPSLAYCKDFYNYDPFFHSIDDFCYKIKKLLIDNNAICTAISNELIPNYKNILNQ